MDQDDKVLLHLRNLMLLLVCVADLCHRITECLNSCQANKGVCSICVVNGIAGYFFNGKPTGKSFHLHLDHCRATAATTESRPSNVDGPSPQILAQIICHHDSCPWHGILQRTFQRFHRRQMCWSLHGSQDMWMSYNYMSYNQTQTTLIGPFWSLVIRSLTPNLLDDPSTTALCLDALTLCAFLNQGTSTHWSNLTTRTCSLH